jgi:hypothetical protein
VIVAIPFFAVCSIGKLEGLVNYSGHRRTLEEKLDFSPITRRAWLRALDENTKYQNELREEIASLEAHLHQKHV